MSLAQLSKSGSEEMSLTISVEVHWNGSEEVNHSCSLRLSRCGSEKFSGRTTGMFINHDYVWLSRRSSDRLNQSGSVGLYKLSSRELNGSGFEELDQGGSVGPQL